MISSPVNTSGRSKPQIVKAVESKLSRFLMEGMDHTLLCRCEKCIQAYLDKMLADYDTLVSTELQVDVGMAQPIEIERWTN